MTTSGAPSRRLTGAVWVGEGLLMFGGCNGTHLNDTPFCTPSQTLDPQAAPRRVTGIAIPERKV